MGWCWINSCFFNQYLSPVRFLIIKQAFIFRRNRKWIMHMVNTSLIPSVNMKKITGPNLQDNVRGSVELMQSFFSELRELTPNDRNSILRAVIIGQEARTGAEIVFAQIKQQTGELGKPPLTKNEFEEFQEQVFKIHAETLSTLIRLSPRFFSDDAHKVLAYSDAQSDPQMDELTTAFIRGARLARDVYEEGRMANAKVGDFMGSCAFWANVLIYGDIRTIKPEGVYMQSLIIQLQYAVLVYTHALKIMRENNLEYEGQGKGFEVALFHEEEPIMLDIKIPVRGEISPARASSLLNSIIASMDIPIADSIHISFIRG